LAAGGEAEFEVPEMGEERRGVIDVAWLLKLTLRKDVGLREALDLLWSEDRCRTEAALGVFTASAVGVSSVYWAAFFSFINLTLQFNIDLTVFCSYQLFYSLSFMPVEK
jgi:hypothetical protein